MTLAATLPIAESIRILYRRFRLFLLIVFRIWDRHEDIVIRLWPRLAWKVARIMNP